MGGGLSGGANLIFEAKIFMKNTFFLMSGGNCPIATALAGWILPLQRKAGPPCFLLYIQIAQIAWKYCLHS
jgi:hypothetical protein